MDYPVLEGRRVFLQDPTMILNDRGRILYVNTHGNLRNLPEEKKWLFEYIKTGKPGKSLLAQKIDEKVQAARYNEHWGNEYMTLEEKVRILMRTDMAEAREEAKAEGREEGLAEGRAEGRAEIARNFLKEGIDVSVIARATGLSTDDIRKL